MSQCYFAPESGGIDSANVESGSAPMFIRVKTKPPPGRARRQKCEPTHRLPHRRHRDRGRTGKAQGARRDYQRRHPVQAADWVQHILDCRGSIRLFDSRLRIFGCLRGFHCGFPPSGFPVSGGFGCARILERAQAWKACGQSFPGLFPGLASGARIVHSLPTPLLFGVVRGLAFLVFRCASSVESDGQSSAGLLPCFGVGAWIAHTFHTFR